MKLLLFFLFSSLIVPVYAQTEKTDQTEMTKQKPVNAPEAKQEQQAEGEKPTNPFQLGPYKDGAYQFWGDEERKERDEREEMSQ